MQLLVYRIPCTDKVCCAERALKIIVAMMLVMVKRPKLRRELTLNDSLWEGHGLIL